METEFRQEYLNLRWRTRLVTILDLLTITQPSVNPGFRTVISVSSSLYKHNQSFQYFSNVQFCDQWRQAQQRPILVLLNCKYQHGIVRSAAATPGGPSNLNCDVEQEEKLFPG